MICLETSSKYNYCLITIFFVHEENWSYTLVEFFSFGEKKHVREKIGGYRTRGGRVT